MSDVNLDVKLCECGCGLPAPLAKKTYKRLGHIKGQPIRFIYGHHRSNFEQRQCMSRGHTGREPVVSPFLPERLVNYNPTRKRWYTNANNIATSTTHAKAVWEYFNGPVPSGMKVHHKNGDASKLENDAVDNLMLLTNDWTANYMPTLAKEFGIPESEVTKAYLAVEHLPYKVRFPAVCRILLEQPNGTGYLASRAV